MSTQVAGPSSEDEGVARVRDALIRDFGFSPEDAALAATYPEMRQSVERTLEGRRAFAEAMARWERAIKRRRKVVRRLLAELLLG
jgi:hypothetical protein